MRPEPYISRLIPIYLSEIRDNKFCMIRIVMALLIAQTVMAAFDLNFSVHGVACLALPPIAGLLSWHLVEKYLLRLKMGSRPSSAAILPVQPALGMI